MGRGRLTAEEQRVLKKHKYVLDVNERNIIYTNEFKFFFMKEYISGKKPTQIFSDAGFDVRMLGSKRIERAASRWRESYEAGSLGTRYAYSRNSKGTSWADGLSQDKSDKQKILTKRCCDQEQLIKTLQATIKLLNTILEVEEAQTGYSISVKDKCKIIEAIARTNNYSITALCEGAGISRQTFYRYKRELEKQTCSNLCIGGIVDEEI